MLIVTSALLYILNIYDGILKSPVKCLREAKVIRVGEILACRLVRRKLRWFRKRQIFWRYLNSGRQLMLLPWKRQFLERNSLILATAHALSGNILASEYLEWRYRIAPIETSYNYKKSSILVLFC